MAKLKQSISLKNVFIDSVNIENGDFTVEEIDKEESRTYNLRDILLKFADIEGVSISISVDESIPVFTEAEMEDEASEDEADEEYA